MKKIISLSILTSIIIGVIAWVASIIFSFSFTEWSFLIGLALSIVLFAVNSSGGAMSKGTNFAASELGWKIQKESEMKVSVGAIFYGSVLFTLFGLILMIIVYF